MQVRARLAEIFPLIDTNRDMHIDKQEMLVWHEENGAPRQPFQVAVQSAFITQLGARFAPTPGHTAHTMEARTEGAREPVWCRLLILSSAAAAVGKNISARRAKREFEWADTNKDGRVGPLLMTDRWSTSIHSHGILCQQSRGCAGPVRRNAFCSACTDAQRPAAHLCECVIEDMFSTQHSKCPLDLPQRRRMSDACALQVTLAEYLKDLLPDDFKGNETLSQIEANPIWKDPIHDWIKHNKVRPWEESQ